MIIYSVTVTVSNTIHEEWLNWMKTKHIQDVVDTGCFVECRMCKILEENKEHRYQIQYLCQNESQMKIYQEQYATALQKEHTEKYKGEFSAFRTMLQLEQTFTPQ